MIDPYWGSVKLLLNFEGADQSTTILDGSSSPKIVEAIGNTKLVTSEKKFGNSCAYFDGNGDYLRMATNGDYYAWATYRNDFTLEMFIKTTDTNALLFDLYQGSNSWQLYLDSSGKVTWWSPLYGYLYGIKSVNDNTWHHIAYCRKNNEYRIYVDGTQDAYLSSSFSFYDLPTYIQIGAQINVRSYDYQGYLDCLRYSMVCRYWPGSQRFTPATTEYSADANTVLLLHFEGTDGSTTFTDSSSNPKTIVSTNATIITSQKKIGSSSCNFPAGTGRLSITHADMALGSGDFTVECWIMPTALTYAWATIARFGVHATNGCLAIARSSSTDPMVVSIDYYYNGWTTLMTTSLSCPINTWTHVAVCRKNGYIMVFINGASSGGSFYVNPSVNANFNQNVLYIGADSNSGECFVGNIDEFRVTKGVARYWGDFDVPTEAFAEEGSFDKTDPYYNNVVLFCTDNNGTVAYDWSTSRKSILQIGYGDTTGAAVFGPSGSFTLNSPSYAFQPAPSKDWALGTGDFTIEAFTWGKGSGSKYYTGTLGIFFYFGEVGEAGGFYCGWAPNESPSAHLKFYLYDGTLILTSNGTFTDSSNWYHIAVVRYNGVLYLYINGILDSSVSFTYNINCNTVYFGNSSTKAFPSYIFCDELKVTKGIARYTSNFEVNRFYRLDIGSKILYPTKEDTTESVSTFSNPLLYLPKPTAQIREPVIEQTLALPWWEGGDTWNETKIPSINKEGIFSGSVKVGTTPKEGVKVFLYHRKTGRKIAGTYSDSNGNFSFSSMGLNNAVSDYFAIALPDDNYNAVIYDKLKPV